MPAPTPAPDGGWGWMVVLGCSLMHALVGGLNRSFSLIYMELQTRYDSSAALTAGVGGCGMALRMGLAPLATGLSSRFGARPVVMVGGVLVGAGMSLCSVAASTEFMFFSYSLLAGFGGSLVFAPAVVLVGQYFTRRRSIAVGISTAGAGIGVFIFPFVIQILFREYSFFGCMLIIGAIEFNNIVCGSLYRPLKKDITKNNDDIDVPTRESKTCANFDDSTVDKVNGKTSHLLEQSKELLPTDESNKEMANDNESGQNACLNRLEIQPLSPSGDCFEKFNKYLNLRLWTNPTFVCYALAMGLKTMTYMPSEMLLPDHAIRSGVPMSYAAMLVSVSGISDAVGRVVVGLLFDLPRIRRHRRHYFTAALLCLGLGVCTFSFSWGLGMFLTFTIINGFLTGAVVGQRSVVIADLVGVENLPSAFGFMVFMQGCGLLIGPLIAGLLKDVSGSYVMSYLFIGGASVLAAIVLFAEYIFFSRNKIKNDKSNRNKTTL